MALIPVKGNLPVDDSFTAFHMVFLLAHSSSSSIPLGTLSTGQIYDADVDRKCKSA